MRCNGSRVAATADFRILSHAHAIKPVYTTRESAGEKRILSCRRKFKRRTDAIYVKEKREK